ncbi:diguanylate cyclase [Aquisphaera insulae]|uniref:diguanylate cyclase n=1 Tax=Aquisphaera insulae TaxID=2712864 RepID=UPI0013EB58AA|nr:diguanylate cyclase [Aquisphaera insulae]
MNAVAEPSADVVGMGAAQNPTVERPPLVRILVVDDNPVDRLRVGRLVERDPRCRAVFAANGLEAMDRLADHAISVVLTDLQMEGMDGLELVRAIRREHAEIPVILMTAHGSERAAMEALRVGASDYVLKNKLAQELQSVLSRPLRTAAAGHRRRACLQALSRQESTYAIGNDLDLVPAMLEILREDLVRLARWDSAELMRVIIAIDEALRNAICHGNLEVSSELRDGGERRFEAEVRRRASEAPYRDRSVRLEVAHDPDRSTFVIRDEGPGFDTSRGSRTIEPEDLLRCSGRGLLLMKSFMDEVYFNRAGNQVTLVKRRHIDAMPPMPTAIEADPPSTPPVEAAATCTDPAGERPATSSAPPVRVGAGTGNRTNESDFARRLLDQLHNAVFYVDRSRHIVYWNEAAERLTGYSAAEVIGRRCSDGLLDHQAQDGCQLCDRGCPLLKAITDKSTTQERAFLRHKDGRRISVDVRSLPVLGEGGAVLGAAQVFTDATSSLMVESAFRQVREAADRDPLTGVANRRYFDPALAAQLENARRSGSPFSLIMADLDHFKLVNDTFGHEVGDIALTRFASVLRLQSRPLDLVARFGGEEFIVLLPGTRVQAAAQIAERLRRATPEATPPEMGSRLLTASFGVAQSLPDEGRTDLLRRVDAALYLAKAQGRDRVAVAGGDVPS